MRLIGTAFALVIYISGVLSAVAQQPDACKTIRAQGAGFLMQCGDTLRLWNLESSDPQWRAGRDLHGRFGFECVVVGSKISGGTSVKDALNSQGATGLVPCADQPGIGGFFIPASVWENGPKDEGAVLDAVRRIPLHAASWSADGKSSSEWITCEAFDARLGDLVGRAACVTAQGMTGSAIVFVAADKETGVVMTFFRDDISIAELKAAFADSLSRLKVVRASGDAALLKWLQ